jgi:hypothetical protein
MSIAMERTIQLERIADMLHTCPVLCEQLSLEGLTCLATCSKALRKATEAVVVSYSLGFLDRA